MENKITKIDGYKKICPYCKTEIISMYEKQLDFNFRIHTETCDENPVIKMRNIK